MRKLALILSTLMLVALAACGDTDPASNTVATPPDDYGTDASPAASGAQSDINEHGTETFTENAFEVELELDNFYFEPTFIKSPGGATATVKLHNEGDVQHTFTIDDLEVDEELAPDEEKTITVEIGTETRYEYYCRFHAPQGMRGALQPH
jgi:plastocyanin